MKSIKAYAIVNKKKPKLEVSEIYEDTHVFLNEDENIIRVEIKEIKNDKTRTGLYRTLPKMVKK